MFVIGIVICIVGLNIERSVAETENCTWAKGKFMSAEFFPSFIKSQYVECLTQSIELAVTEKFKSDHYSGGLGNIDYEVFAGEGWTPLQMPPGTSTSGNTQGMVLTLVDSELRQASPDTPAGTASMDGYFHFQWKDDRLTWSPSDWGDMSSVEIQPSFAENIWFPLFDVVPEKSKGSSQASELITPTVTSGGMVNASVFLDWEAECSMDIENYPYDSAKCTAKFEGQWLVDNRKITVEVAQTQMRMSENYMQSTYWNYKSASVATVTEGGKQYLEITVEVDRINTSAGVEILTPILIATIIAILAPLFGTFKWQSVIKVIALLFMYLSLMNFVQIHWVTRYATGIPKLLEFHRFVMVVTVVALMVSLLMWAFERRSPSMPPPHLLTKITERLASICFCTSVNVQDEGAERSTDDQWAQALTSFNCVVFFVFLIVYILGIVIYCS